MSNFFSNTTDKTKEKTKSSLHVYLLILFILLIIVGGLTILSCAPHYKELFKNISFYSYMSDIIKQYICIFLGIILFFAAGFTDYKKYQNFSKLNFPLILYLITVILLILPFFSAEHKGAHRWIDLKVFSFQPSELAKVSLVIVLSDFLSRKQKYINNLKYNIIPIVYFAVFAIIILFQKDLGTVILLTLTSIAMFFIAGINKKKIAALAVTGIVPFSALIILFPYRLQRVMDFKNSLFDISAASYNVKLALAAFISGGFFGKGPGQSELKLEHLPERRNDFIFPIIGEEYGFFGTLFVIALFFMLMNIGLSISKKCSDSFGKFLSFGLTVILTFQVLINMAMTTNLIPAKGLPLPFISYGGSSMLISCLIMGILFNIARSSNKNNEK